MDLPINAVALAALETVCLTPPRVPSQMFLCACGWRFVRGLLSPHRCPSCGSDEIHQETM